MPRRRTKLEQSGAPGYDAVLSRFHNPLAIGELFALSRAGAPNGKCLTQELNGLEHTVDQPPSVVLPDYTGLNRGAGMANQLFNCAKSNGCDMFCSQ